MVVALIAVLFASSCSKSHYEGLDSEGHNVSIKYDANGGQFAANADIMYDSYKLDSLPEKANGNKFLYLLDPASEDKGSNKVTVQKTGYVFTGWFAKRDEVTNANGEKTYKYSEKWDFTKSIEIDKTKEYSSNEPVLTLYAGWIKEFEFAFYDKATGLPIIDSTTQKEQAYKFNPILESNEISLPAWNLNTGILEMGEFASVNGKTFVGAYLENGEKITADKITHIGTYNVEAGEAENAVMKLFLEFKDGDWRKASSPAHFTSTSACYELLSDIDFGGSKWAFAHETFTGKIIGNGYTIKNMAISQDGSLEDESKYEHYGLFGKLDTAAEISNVTFDNITVIVNVGTSHENVKIGAFAGELSQGAKLENVTINSIALQLSLGAGIRQYQNASVGILVGSGYRNELSEMLKNAKVELVDAPSSAILTYIINYKIDENGNDLIDLNYEYDI